MAAKASVLTKTQPASFAGTTHNGSCIQRGLCHGRSLFGDSRVGCTLSRLLSALVLCCIALVLVLVPSSKPLPAPGLDLELLQSQGLPPLEVGDVVFRMGVSADSAIIAQVSNSAFSHVGMVASVEPEVMIVHATTDDVALQQDQVIVSSLSFFTSLSSRFAVKRYELTETEKEVITAFLYHNVGKDFVLSGHKDDLYCSTLVTRTLGLVRDVSYLRFSFVDVPVLGGLYLFPQTIFTDRHSALIFNSAAL